MQRSELLESETNTRVERVLAALRTMRVARVNDEYELQERIKQCLTEHNITYEKEYRLGSRSRVDFLAHGGIAIEVKRGLTKPNQAKVWAQITRYAQCDAVRAIILVVDRNLHLPNDEINGKPCVSFGLHKLWGIALS